jgi:hypothetical protein
LAGSVLKTSCESFTDVMIIQNSGNASTIAINTSIA